MAGSVQLIKEQHEWFFPGDILRRAEPASRSLAISDDPGNADKIFRRQLRAQQRFAFQPDLPGELLNQARLANARLPPHEHGPRYRRMKQHIR